MTQQNLHGKVALVTGAGSGLGEATANVLSNSGCTVIGLDIDGDAAQRVCCELNQNGSESLGVECDVSDADAVFGAVSRVIDQFGRLDIVVNCAGIDHTASVDEMTVEQWDRILGVNLRGPFVVSKAALPTMRRQRSGHIINIASTASLRAWSDVSAYAASKWGLVGFGRALGVEGRADGIRVTTVIPGGMRTHFFDRFEAQGIPMPDEANLQDPATVARVILHAITLPPESVMQEVMVTPLTETSWP